jgi:hypothetical protein
MSRSCGLRHAYPGRTVEKVAGRIAAVSALRGGHKDSATGGDPTRGRHGHRPSPGVHPGDVAETDAHRPPRRYRYPSTRTNRWLLVMTPCPALVRPRQRPTIPA